MSIDIVKRLRTFGGGEYRIDAANTIEQLRRQVAELTAGLAAAPKVQSAPPGYVLVPDYRGYVALGTGQYILDISAAGETPELIIHVATEEEKKGRTVGDLRDQKQPVEPIRPEKMAVRIAFFNVAGLDALEQQLRILREEHFA